MNSLHLELLKLLKEIDNICKKYNITYYAAGGTTIGAVRHKGLIPWDDDADLYMTRKEFYRFREAFKKESPSGRVLECLDDNKEYPGTIPRYIDDNTTTIGKFHCMDTCSEGVIIDIFILDPVPNDPEIQRKYKNKLNIYADFVMPYYGFTNRSDNDCFEDYFKYKNLEKEIGRDGVISQLEKELFSFEEDECDYYILRWGTLSHIFEKKMFGTPIYVDFEDMQVPIPERWYDYLVQLYGSKWMYIPKYIEDESHNHIVDTNYKYTNYMVDVDRFIPKAEAASVYSKRKNLLIQREKFIRPFKEAVLDVNSQYVLYTQSKYLAINNINIEKLFKEHRYDHIVHSFQKYLSYQFSLPYIGAMRHAYIYRYNNKKFIPLDDDLLYYLIYSLINIGDFSKARILIDLRKKYKNISDNIKRVDGVLTLIYDVLKSYYTKDYSNFNKLVKEIEKHDSNLLKIKDIEILILSYNINMKPCNSLLSTISELEEKNKNKTLSAEYQKILGDYYYKIKNESKALEFYKKSINNLSNGMMILDINHKYPKIIKKYDLPSSNQIVFSDFHKKQLALLEEFDKICQENDINYILMGDTLLYGYFKHTLTTKFTPCKVAMLPEDALKFINIMETDNIHGRGIEYPLNNKYHNTHNIFYCDNETLNFNWLNIDKEVNNSIHITINIMKRKPSNVFKWFLIRGLDAIRTINLRSRNNKYKKNSKLALALTTPIVKLIGEYNLSKIIFNYYINTAKGKSLKNYYISKNNYKQSIYKYYKSSYFKNLSKINICNYEFNAPKDMVDFINYVYDKYVSERIKIRESQPGLMKIFDCNVSYEEFKENIDMSQINREDFILYKKGQDISYEINKLNKKIKEYWNILFRSEDRFKLYIKYLPLKEKIIELYKLKDYNELELVLSEYDKKARDNMRKNLGLCFDNEIFKIYCELLKHNGEDEFVNQLKKSIPEEHKDEIIIKY
ncbi:LicD family protein [Anaerofustis stercorihominis]|uniref:LicD/FKTN/FKRP nucleotidyltransferase domain-containing protein n=1 Tax=Anaerofustis stercorihominis TaxID=214853 RepID=A0A3E3DZF3_9FIRM|nr:LicD family protein [Anaerofustis stercorihominis]RGD74664.1 hypothetical protein DW687_07865 [Anaerofustis stercorihominis]